MTDPKRSKVHTAEIVVQWRDMDAFGHVNNSIFFAYFEFARIAWWRGILSGDEQYLDQGPVVVNAQCTFLKPIIYPATLSVVVYAGPPGRSSYENFYQIYLKSEQPILCAEGSTKIVWVDRKSGRSIPLPAYLREKLPQQ
jgi:acyl-CoA thioester hydrolase